MHASPTLWVKSLTVNPGEALSYQYHKGRDEVWIPTHEGLSAVIDGVNIDLETDWSYVIPAGVKHRLYNSSEQPASLIEVATGWPDENDIVRLEDNYGRA
jgi:mannose-6-phosphate isomerase-like protein (cupin superfamily)